jgi:hypothetical protein
MAKHYNPFKMWGAWVGAVLGISLPWVLAFFNIRPFFGGSDPMGQAISQVIFGIPLGIILGFLVGWGIHSLVRKLK